MQRGDLITVALQGDAGAVPAPPVAEAIKALEFAGVLTWQNRIVRIRERCRDLFGRNGWRWRVIRTSNAYVLIDPASKSDQGPEHQIKRI